MLEVRTYAPLRRGRLPDDVVAREAEATVARVRTGGAEALLAAVREHGGAAVGMDTLRVSEEEIADSRQRVSDQFLTSLSIARVNIRRFHEYQRRQGYVHDDSGGVRLTRQVRPLGRAGILCGTSFMALLTHAVPAQVAGVRRIAVAAAPDADGGVDPRMLAAAKSLGIEEIYRMSGAEAVAAMAFGAGPVERTDKIVGPGGVHAAAAKRHLSGIVGVDGDPGRGEFVVVADGGANAKFIAADLLAQAEHGAGGILALLTNDRILAESVRIEISRLAESLPNREEALAVLDACGAIRLLPSIDAAIDAANAIAPARLSLQTVANDRYLPDIDTAGAVFVGPWAAEMAGDYFAGVNGFLGVGDFVREIPVVELAPERLSMTGRHLVELAGEESLPAHAEAIRQRLDVLHAAGGN